TATRLPPHLDITPAHAMIPACPQRFHPSFFGREARGIALHPICLRLAIANFTFGKNALENTLSVTLDRLSYARNFGNVDARTDDHAANLSHILEWSGSRPKPGNRKEIGSHVFKRDDRPDTQAR